MKNKERDRTLIKGPKNTMTKLSTELFDELAKEGFARIEGLGTFRKSGSSYEFIPTKASKIEARVEKRVTSKIVDLSEENEPYWLGGGVDDKRARIPNAGMLELSDVHIPSGRAQQKVLQDRYEKHQERKVVESRNKKLKTYRIGFGIAAVLAIGILSSPFWLGENEADLPSNDSQVVALQTSEASSSDASNTLRVSTSLSNPAEGLQAETIAQPEDEEKAISVPEDGEAVILEQDLKKEQVAVAAQSSTGVQETKAIEALGPQLGTKEESKKEKVKVTPPSQLKAEVGVGNQFAIVAASMKSIPSAKSLVDDLRQKGFVAEVVVSPVDGQTFYRVVLGRFKTSAEALEANKSLGGEYWVTRLSFASQLLSI